MKHLDIYPRSGIRRENTNFLKKQILKILPFHVLSPLKFEARLAIIRLKSCLMRPFKESGIWTDPLVNIGSGPFGKNGWINIDAIKFPNVNLVLDARRKLPFDTDSVKGIFCEHFFEHLDYTEEVPYFLSECFRVLKPNGFLRIIVPDAEKYLNAYINNDWTELSRIRPLDDNGFDVNYHHKYNTRMELINAVFHQGIQHKFAYDYETVKFLFERYGFREVTQRQFGESGMPEICIDQARRESESLYVEGVK